MEALNVGVLVIMLDNGSHGKHYQGIVSFRGNSLAQSVEGYFRESEQLATKIWLAVDDTKAAGLLLQVMPGTNKESSGQIEKEIYPRWGHIVRLTQGLEPNDLLHLDHQDLLSKLYTEEDIRVFRSQPISFQCPCSRRRGEDAIQLLGRDEAEAELKSHQSIVVTCDFCNKEYIFDRVDVTKIFESKDRTPPDKQLH
jgi:molecular chaperone Hsp33